MCSSKFLNQVNLLLLEQYFKSSYELTPSLSNQKQPETTKRFHHSVQRYPKVRSHCNTVPATKFRRTFLLLKPCKNVNGSSFPWLLFFYQLQMPKSVFMPPKIIFYLACPLLFNLSFNFEYFILKISIVHQGMYFQKLFLP